jgi:hypothetical protein
MTELNPGARLIVCGIAYLQIYANDMCNALMPENYLHAKIAGADHDTIMKVNEAGSVTVLS